MSFLSILCAKGGVKEADSKPTNPEQDAKDAKEKVGELAFGRTHATPLPSFKLTTVSPACEPTHPKYTHTATTHTHTHTRATTTTTTIMINPAAEAAAKAKNLASKEIRKAKDKLAGALKVAKKKKNIFQNRLNEHLMNGIFSDSESCFKVACDHNDFTLQKVRLAPSSCAT